MNKKSLSERVFAKINQKKIERKAKWTFLLRNYVVWGAGLVSLFVGGLSFSVVIYMMIHNAWGEYSYVSDSFLQFIFLTLPYFWFVFLGVFVFIANYYIKHTKKGYRYRLPSLIFASILVSFILGGFFYNIGMGEAIDDVLGKQAPFYQEFINPNMMRWNIPEKGLLSGKIITKNSDSEFVLRDINNLEWLIFCDDCLNVSPSIFEEGMQINLFGKSLDSNSFVAKKLKLMGPGRGFFMRSMEGMERHMQGNSALLKKRIKMMPQMIKQNPEMREVFLEHMMKNKFMVKELFDEMPGMKEEFDELRINLESK